MINSWDSKFAHLSLEDLCVSVIGKCLVLGQTGGGLLNFEVATTFLNGVFMSQNFSNPTDSSPRDFSLFEVQGIW